MKLLALLLASAGLSGCVAYAPYGAAPGYYYNGAQRRLPLVSGPPVRRPPRPGSRWHPGSL